MGKPTIKILDVVHCKANKEARKLIKKSLSYEDVVRKRNRFGVKGKEVVTRHLITGREGTGGTFLSGLLPRVEKAIGKTKETLQVNGSLECLPEPIQPALPGITFRPDQKKAFCKIAKYQRGMILFPTGSGKTIIELGVASMWPQCRILWLCHTLDLLEQFTKEAKIYGFANRLVKLRGGYDPPRGLHNSAIVASTIQSVEKLDLETRISQFDIVMVDEAHHVHKEDSRYGTVLRHCLAPGRLGMTATAPNKQRGALVNEGLFGPIIAELKRSQGIKRGILAKPKITILPVPFDDKLDAECSKGKSFKKYYNICITNNKIRNRLIVREVRRTIKKNETVLIIIEYTDHGKILKDLLKKNGIKAPFVYGETPSERRVKIKNQLALGKKQIVIASRVWKEGVNIPSLNKVILAYGMKDDKGTIQAIGRGFRTTVTKKVIELVDFLDPYPYLAQHSIARLSVYAKEKWI
ncbi:hypothetical protein AYK24_06655 [Thermoplasmatales archaeon SG8-52-4]|nr:MAG: hypothetical protein AYK24_06655 [Thermoplasmatales archaeon SG8-52-4]